jgi:PKD repeat protein
MIRRYGLGIWLFVLLGLTGCDLLTGNRAPVAIAEAEPTRGEAPLRVEFDGSRSTDPDGLIVHYEWDFGDGSQAEGPKVTYTYERNGIYIATLTVVDSFGASDQDRVRIVVGNPPPQAVFTASPTSGWRPLRVSFDASASFDPEDEPIVGYEWDLGDGTSASGVRVSHTYSEAGKFTARLTVKDQDGATSTATLDIYVLDFISADEFRVERSPMDVLVLDLDGDGRLDLAVANSESDEIALFFGRPGGFSRGGRLAVGRRPVALAKGDFNGDGLPDLVSANLDAGSVSLILNEGGRSFREAEELFIGRWASAVAVADLSGDGLLDLAAADPGRDQVVVLEGDGLGSFAIGEVLPTGRWPAALATGDFDRDGLTDLAIVHFLDDSVMLLLGDGAGGFIAGSSVSVDAGPVDLALADLNGDGRLDLVVANSKGGSLSVLLGRGGGRFEPTPRVLLREGVRAVVVEDFDRDGSLDVACAGGGAVTVLLGEGSRRLQDAQIRSFPAPGGPTALAAGDFDGDGFSDLVATQFEGDLVSILLNQL